MRHDTRGKQAYVTTRNTESVMFRVCERLRARSPSGMLQAYLKA